MTRAWRQAFHLQALRWRVRWHLLWQHPAQALRLLDERLLAQATDGWARATRSVLHQRAGRSAAALADAQALVQLASPVNAAACFNLGYLLEADGQWDAACAAFEQATQLQDTLDTAWYGLGLAHLRAGRLAQAVAPLRRCTELQPFSPHAWYQLARLHAERDDAQALADVITHVEGFEPRIAARLREETACPGKACA